MTSTIALRNIVDIVIIVLIVVGALVGLKRGFIVQVAAILGAFIALFVAKREFHLVRHLLEAVASKSPWLTVISYLIVFLAVWGVVMLIARLARRGARLMLLGGADRLGGFLLGLLQGAVVIELLVYLGRKSPSGSIHHALKHSTLAGAFLHIIPYVDRLFPYVPK